MENFKKSGEVVFTIALMFGMGIAMYTIPPLKEKTTWQHALGSFGMYVCVMFLATFSFAEATLFLLRMRRNWVQKKLHDR